MARFADPNWELPIEICHSVGFVSGVALAYDAAGDPIAVWTQADATGLSITTSTAEELLEAVESGELYYTVRRFGPGPLPPPSPRRRQ